MQYVREYELGIIIATDVQEDVEDLDRVTPTLIDDILERELGQGYSSLENGLSWNQPERDSNSSSGRLARYCRCHDL